MSNNELPEWVHRFLFTEKGKTLGRINPQAEAFLTRASPEVRQEVADLVDAVISGDKAYLDRVPLATSHSPTHWQRVYAMLSTGDQVVFSPMLPLVDVVCVVSIGPYE